MDPAATLSAPSVSSILATVGVQDGLLASLRLASLGIMVSWMKVDIAGLIFSCA